MALIKWNNKDLESPSRNFMDGFFGRNISDFVDDFAGTVPSVNIQETKDEVKLDVAAPGMRKEDFLSNPENNCHFSRKTK
jgi:HSP20 family protein